MDMEQVRDAILRFMDSHDDAAGSQSLTDCVASLDAAISRDAEPVAWWTRGAATGESVFSTRHPDDPNVAGWAPLFAHPPEPARDAEVTNEMVLRACHASLDWPHPLTHFEARKALEAAMTQEH